MKNLLALVGLAVVAFAGVGWYMGWYKVKVDRSASGELQVETKVNTKQVSEDTSNWLQQAGKFLDSKVQKASEDAKTPQPGPAGTTPGPVTSPTGSNANQGTWLLPPQTYPLSPQKP